MTRSRKAQQEDDGHRAMLDRAFAEAAHSPHPKVQVGAIITTPDGKTILGKACNGFADGVQCLPQRLRDGQKSYWIMCAEKRAIAAARKNLKKHGLQSLKGCRLYSTLEPCHTCADDIVCAGIGSVICPDEAHQHHPRLKPKWRKSIRIGALKLEEVGITLSALPYSPD